MTKHWELPPPGVNRPAWFDDWVAHCTGQILGAAALDLAPPTRYHLDRGFGAWLEGWLQAHESGPPLA